MWVLFSFIEFWGLRSFQRFGNRQRKEKSCRSWVGENWDKLSLEKTFQISCDFNDDFLYIEDIFVENVSVVNGWKLWLFVEGTSTSDVLICDYFVGEKWDFWKLITVWNMTDNQYCRIIYGNKYVFYRAGGPYGKKLCPRSWVRPEAVGRGPYWRPRAQFFPIRTDLAR